MVLLNINKSSPHSLGISANLSTSVFLQSDVSKVVMEASQGETALMMLSKNSF